MQCNVTFLVEEPSKDVLPLSRMIKCAEMSVPWEIMQLIPYVVQATDVCNNNLQYALWYGYHISNKCA